MANSGKLIRLIADNTPADDALAIAAARSLTRGLWIVNNSEKIFSRRFSQI